LIIAVAAGVRFRINSGSLIEGYGIILLDQD
jgi:hypothetical protein